MAEPYMAEPDWLAWTRELQAIAQSGLTFAKDPYDIERYQQLRALASAAMSRMTGTPAPVIEALFAGQHGYATPKVDVRAAAFDGQGRLLMVRELADGGRWTLPGGWADVNLSPAENAVKEMKEESGFDVRVRKLAAAWDRTRQNHPPTVFSCAKFFFICDITGGAATTSIETGGVGWFAEEDVPAEAELSLGRVLPRQIARMFAHHRQPELPTEFD